MEEVFGILLIIVVCSIVGTTIGKSMKNKPGVETKENNFSVNNIDIMNNQEQHKDFYKERHKYCPKCGISTVNGEMCPKCKRLYGWNGSLIFAIILICGMGYGLYSCMKESPKHYQKQYKDSTIHLSPTGNLVNTASPEAVEGMAFLINANGFLCAKVININTLSINDKTYEVRCIEYRGGSGAVDYIVDLGTGRVFKR